MSSLSKQTQLAQLLPTLTEHLAQGRAVSFSPRGTSMRPMLRQGVDTVELVAVSGKLQKYDLPLYRRANGQFVLHRIIEVHEDYTCMGDNQFEPEYSVKPEQVIAVVRAFTRGKRRIEVTDPGYRLYCRLWYAAYPLRRFGRRVVNVLKRRLQLKKHD